MEVTKYQSCQSLHTQNSLKLFLFNTNITIHRKSIDKLIESLTSNSYQPFDIIKFPRIISFSTYKHEIKIIEERVRNLRRRDGIKWQPRNARHSIHPILRKSQGPLSLRGKGSKRGSYCCRLSTPIHNHDSPPHQTLTFAPRIAPGWP